MGLMQRIEAEWRRRGVLACLLLPLALLFASAVNLRRLLYRLGWLTSVGLPVPVVVIGNITAGGSGKTPLTLYLARELASRGWRPGIVSRGYGGRVAGVAEVSAGSDASYVGDEPLLLARRSGCPVFVGRDRIAASHALLSAHTDCNILISDDGLQHLRLGRAIEVVVLDERGVGNGWPLPAGFAARVHETDRRSARSGAQRRSDRAVGRGAEKTFRMHLKGERFRNLHQAERTCGAAELKGKQVHALAGIGDPGRFFGSSCGWDCKLKRMLSPITMHTRPRTSTLHKPMCC